MRSQVRLVPAAHQAELAPRRPRAAQLLVERARSAGQCSARPPAAARTLRQRAARAPRWPRPRACEQAVGDARPHPGQQLRHAEGGQRVARVLGPAQTGQRVLDVGRLEKAQAAELHERDVAAAELHLERVAVVRGAEQHRLLPQRHARLAPLEHARDHVIDLAELVGHGDQRAAAPRRRAREKSSCVALGGERDDRVGRVEDRLRRAVVLFQRDHRGAAGRTGAGSPRMLPHAGGAEAVDRLRVVAHHRHPAPVGLEPRAGSRPAARWCPDTRRPARGRSGRRRAPPAPASRHQVEPVEQQIVVVEHRARRAWRRRRRRTGARSASSHSRHQGKRVSRQARSGSWVLTARE